MYRINSRSFALASLVALSLACSATIAANGDLDPGFGRGGGGAVFTPVGDGLSFARASAIQADGKIVVAGYGIEGLSTRFAVARYLPNGQLDPTFAGGGTLATDLGNGSAAGLALALQADGKILVGGYSDDNFALVRYTRSGTLDPTFGDNGVALTPIGAGKSEINALALQVDGRIVAAGFAESSNGSNDFALARYLPDGRLDPAFGLGGVVTTSFGDGSDEANGVAIQADGRIVVAGITVNPTTTPADEDVALARYLTDGTLDTGFGINGKVTASLPNAGYNEFANAVALQSDGKIVIAGGARTDRVYEEANDFLVIRFLENGSLDPTFGSGGIVASDFDRYDDTARALAIQPDRQIVAAGNSATETGDPVISIIRLGENGALDITFGNGGQVVTSASRGLYAHALAIQPDGKFVVAGVSSNNFAVWRHLARDENDDQIAEPWGLTPAPFAFNNVSGVPLNTLQISNLITIAGLETGLQVPVSVCGGEYAVNGATVYTRGVSYVGNGDQINLRHLSAPETGMQTDTILSVGGWSAPNTPTLLTGSPTRATFSSVTVGTPTGALNPNGCVAAPEDNGGSTQPPTLGEPPTDPAAGNGTALPDVTPVARSGGGGITGWLSLALLALAGIRRQRHA